jgi:DNA-directed RNA polymerase subunit L
MSSAVLQQSVIDELRLCAGGAIPTMRELRLAIDCSAAELAGAVQALRYGGKLKWDALELSPSMIDQDTVSSRQREETPRSVGCDERAAGGAKPIPDEGGPTAAGPDDEDDEDYPGGVNDIDGGSCAGTADDPAAAPEPQPVTGFGSRRQLHSAGIHAANTRAAAAAAGAGARARDRAPGPRGMQRNAARRPGALDRHRPAAARAAQIRGPDMTLAESVSSMLAEDPHDLIVAVNRRHPLLWRRVLLLGRASAERPAQALYAAIERGLDELEAELPHTNRRNAMA